MKIVVGCEGMRAKQLKDAIVKKGRIPSAKAVYRVASQIGFGCKECRVVITKTENCFKGDGGLDERYQQTFERASFNPRWEHGTADHIEIADF